MPLHLVRNITPTISEYGYFAKTEVWAFGDRQGYIDLIADLDRARKTRDAIHVAAIPRSSRGMLCVVLPATNFRTRRSALRIIERTVFVRGEPAMQVVLCGNRRAYSRLAGIVRDAIAAEGDPVEHWHCNDDYTEWIEKRSIALNLRGAVKGWGRKQLNNYFDFVRSGGNHRLPENFDYLRDEPANQHDDIPPDMADVLQNQR